jgi:hypothetical protein
MIIAAMVAVGPVEWPLAPLSIPADWNLDGSIDRFGGMLRIDDVAPNINCFSLPAMLLMCAALGNLLLLRLQGRRHDAMPA